MRYFKIRVNYGNGDDSFVRIDETEVEKAYLCFLTDAKGIFSGGPVRGQDIITVHEDWHREFGWNPGHRMDTEDWKEVSIKGKHYAGFLGMAKERVQYMIKSGQEHLVGTGADLPLLTAPVDPAIKNLIDAKKI